MPDTSLSFPVLNYSSLLSPARIRTHVADLQCLGRMGWVYVQPKARPRHPPLPINSDFTTTRAFSAFRRAQKGVAKGNQQPLLLRFPLLTNLTAGYGDCKFAMQTLQSYRALTLTRRQRASVNDFPLSEKLSLTQTHSVAEAFFFF